MHPSKNNSVCSYNLKNCFGFNEDDVDLSFWNNASVLNSTLAPIEFQTSKPYRLALYARPSDRRRINSTSILRCENTKPTGKKNDISNMSNISNISSRAKDKSQVKNTRHKAKSVMLFDENTKPEMDRKKQEKTPEKSKLEISSILKTPNSRKKVLTEVNTKVLTKTKQVKVRRSYERKCKGNKPEIIPERPSSEIIKEMEIKKLTRTKVKKLTKEEQEFEKWASNVNSDFNDVDKFELSIAYD